MQGSNSGLPHWRQVLYHLNHQDTRRYLQTCVFLDPIFVHFVSLNSLEKTLMLGEIEEKRAAEDEMDSITDSVDMNLSKLWETVEDRGAWRAAVHGVTKNWVDKIPWRRDRLPTPVFLGFPCGSAGKESACNAGDLGSIPGLGRSLEKGEATHSSILAWRIPWTV